MARHLRLREFVVGVQGIALMRGLLTGSDEAAQRRIEEVGTVVADSDQEPFSALIEVPTFDVDGGYGRWSSTYDAPGNPLISAEQPVVWRLLERAAPGLALDAACGTGRHARRLIELGHHVTGVDLTPAMLARAEEKVPQARFVQGELGALPLGEDSVDLAVCALALEHIEDLGPPIAELARVVRPGGTVIISDSHPVLRAIGGAPYFEDVAGTSGVVRSYKHSHGDYLAAFARAGLDVHRCIEVPFAPEQIAMQEPVVTLFPEATEAAFLGLPAVLVWDLAVRTTERVALDHVQLAVPHGCETAARRFFGELLGLTELEKPPGLRARGGVWFSLGAQQLHIGVQEPFSPAAKAHPALRVPAADLDAIAGRLRATGAEVAWDDSLPGERRFFTKDPWGNRIELLSRA